MPDEFKVVQISGGITNNLFKCEIAGSPPVIVRVYGAKTEQVIDRHSEEVLCNSLSQNGFGCKIYGRFANGSLEEFLPGSCPTPTGMKEPLLQELIARKLFQMHSLSCPLPKVHDINGSYISVSSALAC